MEPITVHKVQWHIIYYAKRSGSDILSCRQNGGENAPYLWLKTPNGKSSWDFFNQMLYEVNVVGTPGIGFGPSGEGFIRLTAFGERERCEEAIRRLEKSDIIE